MTFESIEQKLLEWNLKSVYGRGLYVKYTGKYGHIELEISKQFNEKKNEIIWNIPDSKIKNDIDYKPHSEVILNEFFNYFYELRGDKNLIKIEIQDGSYHPVDSQGKHYKIATMYALVDCFDKKAYQFQENRICKI